MTTSFNVTKTQLIAGALRLIGALSQGETATAAQTSEASEALNLMIKAWEADGMPLWGLTTIAIPIVAGQTTYQIAVGSEVNVAKPLKVIQAWNRNTTGSVDTPMRIITKSEYAILGNKTSRGMPIQLYYNPQKSIGELSLFPTPDSTSQANNQIYITYQRPYDDITLDADTPDFPQEWLEALKYGLAVRLAPEYGLPTADRNLLSQEAKNIKDLALSFGVEEGSYFMQVTRRNW